MFIRQNDRKNRQENDLQTTKPDYFKLNDVGSNSRNQLKLTATRFWASVGVVIIIYWPLVRLKYT